MSRNSAVVRPAAEQDALNDDCAGRDVELDDNAPVADA